MNRIANLTDVTDLTDADPYAAARALLAESKALRVAYYNSHPNHFARHGR